MANEIPLAFADVELQLSAPIDVSDTSFTLSSATDDDGNALPAGLYCFTIDNGKSNKEYLIGSLSGTTVSSISSVSRQGSLTANAQKKHRTGATAIISNFVSIQKLVEVMTGQDSLDGTNPLYYDAQPTLTSDEELATKKYADDLAIAGSPDASVTVKGIVEEATEAEINADTAAGGTSARLFVNPSTLRTSEYGLWLPTSGEKSGIAGNDGTVGAANLLTTETGVQKNKVNYAADAEASDTYVITLDPVPGSLTTGQVIEFKANTANTGACTLNVNSLGAVTIKKHHDQDLDDNDIESGQIVTVVYDGTNFQMQSQSANAPQPAGEAFTFIGTFEDSGSIGSTQNDDTVFTPNFQAAVIEIHYWLSSHDGAQKYSQGIARYNGTTLVSNTEFYAELADAATVTSSSSGEMQLNQDVPTAAGSNAAVALSINALDSTTFTVRAAFTVTANNAQAKYSVIAWR